MCRRIWERFVRLALLLLLVAVAPCASAAAPPLLNGDFEMGYQDGQVPGWPSPFGAAVVGENVALTDARAYDGRYSIRIQDDSDQQSVGLRTAPIPAEPGVMYVAQVYVYNENGTGQLYLEFWNDQGVRIHHVIAGSSTPGAWTAVRVEELAPPGTTALTLLIYSHQRNVGVTYYDGVTLTTRDAASAVEADGTIAGVPPVQFDWSEASFPLPPLEELRARIPEGRPRLFARPETLDELREKRNRSLMVGVVWRNIQTKAIMARVAPLPPEPPDARPGGQLDITAWRQGISIANEILDNLHALGFAYLITGDSQYAEAGKALLLHVARWNPYGTSGRAKNDEVSMRLLYGMSRAYDWLYPALTPQERQVVQESMRARGNDVYLTMRRIKFEETLLDNHLTRSMGFLGEAAIAFMGDFPEAEVWFDYIVSLFALRYPPWGGEEGGWSQGVSYWQSYISWVLEFLDAFKIATGVDLYQKPFFRNTGWFKFYAHPPKSKVGAFGDHSDVPPDRGAARVMSHLAYTYRIPAFQWYASTIEGGGRLPILPLDNFLGYVRMPVSADELFDPEFPADFAQSRLFTDVGWAIMNVDMEDWENNVHIKFKSSPYGSFNHSHAEQNSFMIEAYGSPLAISSGYYPWYGSPHHATWTWESRSKNTILVNGRGQRVQSIDAKGQIVRASFGSQFDYVIGDATQAYEGRIDRFWRHLWFIKPNLILIYDQLEAPGETTYDWLLHTEQRMDVDPEAARVRVPAATAEMWVTLVHPHELSFSLTDQFTVPPEEREAHKPNQWHLNVTAVAGDGRGRFLAVMIPRPAREAQEPPPAVAELQVDNGHGAVVRHGEKVYTLAFRDDPAAPVRGEAFVAHADAFAWWHEGSRHGWMALAATQVAQGETWLLRTEGQPVDVGLEWRCEAEAPQLHLQLSAAADAPLELWAPCVPAAVWVNGKELAAEHWSVRADGIVVVEPAQ